MASKGEPGGVKGSPAEAQALSWSERLELSGALIEQAIELLDGGIVPPKRTPGLIAAAMGPAPKQHPTTPAQKPYSEMSKAQLRQVSLAIYVECLYELKATKARRISITGSIKEIASKRTELGAEVTYGRAHKKYGERAKQTLSLLKQHYEALYSELLDLARNHKLLGFYGRPAKAGSPPAEESAVS